MCVVQQMNKMVAYTQTKTDSEYVVNYFKRFMVISLFINV